MSERLEIDLSPEHLEHVQGAVEDGQYDSPSAVVAEALSLWEKQREQQAVEELRRLIAEADASGYEPWEGADALNARLREKYASQLRK